MDDALHVLLVERDDDIAFLVRKSLQQAGYLVTTCRSGADALLALGKGAYGLVIAADDLADMKGADFLRESQRANFSAPILVLLASGTGDHAAPLLRAGAMDVLIKDSNLIFLVEVPKRAQETATYFRLQQ